MKGVQFGGRVRVRVRVRVSQGSRRFAKGEGKGAREPHQPFSPKGHFSKDLWSGGSNNAGLIRSGLRGWSCGVPSFHAHGCGDNRSIAVFEP